jgi:hypothetical protein
MKRTYSKPQEAYLLARAYLETLEEQEKKADHQFIIDNGITNPDGSIPQYLYCIENDELFEKASAEYDAKGDNGLWNEILEARKTLELAEKNLIKYALSIIPSKNSHEKAVLEKEVETNYTTRKKVVELVLKLDVSTIRR